MLRGVACRLSSWCCPPQAHDLQDGPGCATPAAGDPCRTRTCAGCVRSSRPAARRTGRTCCCAEGGGFEPRGLSTSTNFRNWAPATPAAPSKTTVVSPVRFERTTLAFGGQRSVPLSYGELAPEARFKLTTGASHAPVLFTTPPGSDSSGTHRGATRTGLEPVPPGLTVRCSSVELTRQVGPDVPESGWPESNRRPRRPERRALPACATARCDSWEGGDDPQPPGSEPGVLPATPLPNGASPEGRTPIRGVRARLVTSYRRDAEGESPARSCERRRGTPAAGSGPRGARHRRVGRRSTGLSPGYGRRESNSHGPGPPASEAGASSNSATSAKCARLRDQLKKAVGRLAQWTQTDSNRLRPPCGGGALPLVRWAHESAGQESNLPCKSAWVTARCRPTTAARGWGPISSRDVAYHATIDPTAGDLSIVKELFGRDEPSLLRKWIRRTRRGARESNPVFGGFGSPPATGASPLCRAVLVLCRSGNQKSRLRVEAALERSQTLEGPVHPFESASLERRSKHIACSTPACDVTRDVDRATCPSIHR